MNGITVLDSADGDFTDKFKAVFGSITGGEQFDTELCNIKQNRIIVLSESYDTSYMETDGYDRCVFIVSENNKQALLWLSRAKIPAICCGMDSSCSVSISSMYDSTCVVSVLRKIVSPLGRVTEPMEYPVYTEINDRYAVMAAMTASILQW